jgi:hypothetical protein
MQTCLISLAAPPWHLGLRGLAACAAIFMAAIWFRMRKNSCGKALSGLPTDVGHMLGGTGWNPRTQYNVGPFKTRGHAGRRV